MRGKRKSIGKSHPIGAPRLFLACLATFLNSAAAELRSQTAAEHYLGALSQFNQDWNTFLQNETSRLSKIQVSDEVTAVVNPWGRDDQETNFFPTLPPILREDPLEDQELEAINADTLAPKIPPRFRLAQLIGLGTNMIRWNATPFDSSVVTYRGRPVSYRTMVRLRYTFHGEFTPFQTGALPIESFRAYRESRSYCERGVVTIDIPWSIKHYRVLNYSVRRMTTSSPTPWIKERLHENLADNLNEISLVGAEFSERKTLTISLKKEISRSLNDWKSKMARSAIERLEQQNLSKSDQLLKSLLELDQAHQALKVLQSSSGHTPNHCLRDELARLPSKTSVLAWLREATIDTSQQRQVPWEAASTTKNLVRQWEAHIQGHLGFEK